MNLEGKKILVTGGGGFIGAFVVKELLTRGIPRDDIFIPHAKTLDLRTKKNCEEAVRGKDVVIHLAGVTGNADFHRTHPADIFYDNVTMGLELMETARRVGVEKFVIIGSATEYPENAPLPLREESLWDGLPEKYHAPYAIAKRVLGAQAEMYRLQYGFNAIHLISTSVYGPGAGVDSGPVSSIVHRISEAKRLSSKTVVVWGTGIPTRDFLYVEDVAKGIVFATEGYEKSNPVNLGSGTEISIAHLVELIGGLMGYDGTFVFDSSKPDGQARRILDVSRANQEFGFRAQTTLKEGLLKTIEWYNTLR